MKSAIENKVDLELNLEELQLIQDGLRLLLVVEDDRVAIEQLKALIERIDKRLAAIS